ncbi:class I SAM-dependent methyltransferase [Spiribacter insolitus]|uniref:Methyltransferase domain-containing protein n=1 Tax=Spiribacter insolitus TaxID=3122417 RepID=A0ABV3T4T4_9GAMM
MEYDEIFEARGSAYDHAMRALPRARAAEFRQLISRLAPQTGETLADVPAGGGYMAGYLPAGVVHAPYEPCVSFTNHGDTTRGGGRPLLPLPWKQDSVDAVASLAGVHHITDKAPFFSELRRVVHAQGRLGLSDVAAGSAVALFLDEFVGAHNTTGHEGVYLDQTTVPSLRQAGWEVTSDEIVEFHWVFDSKIQAGEFGHDLFGLVGVTPSAFADAMEARLGFDPLPDGGVGLRWALRTIIATPV